MRPILSIGITSYKRIAELERCIKSIHTKYADDIEVIVSEDCSPLSTEIGEKVNEISKNYPYNLSFMPNEHNLGYDGNLGAIIKKSQGKYVFLMSDDDAFYEGFLDILIPFIKDENNNYGVIYGPFVYTFNKRKDRNYGRDMIIEKGEYNCSKHVYDSILFSGLIFRKEYVEGFDASRFLNMNYFQVYMFLKMIHNYGGYYFAHPSVWCVGDGENAYGLSESSGGNELLVNRKSVISNLEFNKTLIRVIRIFDEEENTHIITSFEKQYSLHSYSGLSVARRMGLSYFNEYWKKLNSLDIGIRPIAKAYYYLLLVMGSNLSDRLTSIARKRLKNDEKVD